MCGVFESPRNPDKATSMLTQSIIGMSTKSAAQMLMKHLLGPVRDDIFRLYELPFQRQQLLLQSKFVFLRVTSRYALKRDLSNSGKGLWWRVDRWVHRNRSTVLLCHSAPSPSVSSPQQDAHPRRRQHTRLMEPDMTVQTELP